MTLKTGSLRFIHRSTKLKAELDANKKRSKELRDCLRCAEMFKSFKPVYDELCAIQLEAQA